MQNLEVFILPVLTDNYIFILRDHQSKKTAVIDPAESEPVLKFLEEKKWQLDYVWNTHHHFDHVGGNLQLQEATNCQIIGSSTDETRIPGINIKLQNEETFLFGQHEVFTKQVFGHTLGHICFYLKKEKLLFSGDVIFALGCGRLFEGTPQQMWQSLSWVASLPQDCHIYCTHEYTMDNAAFATHIDPENEDLRAHIQYLRKKLQSKGQTVPTSVADEVLHNPFLRASSSHLKKQLKMDSSDDIEVFAQIRKIKDTF